MARGWLSRELRRRHVYRVAVAYVVVGWLLILVYRPAPASTLAFGDQRFSRRSNRGLHADFLKYVTSGSFSKCASQVSRSAPQFCAVA